MATIATKIAHAISATLISVLALGSDQRGPESNTAAVADGADTCRKAEVAVQVLGSGGPIAEGYRAGTSYVVWIGGRARLMIDAGPGSFIRFGEAGLKVRDLEAIALSHFHADHSAGLTAILNSGSFEQNSEPLIIIGPAAGNVFPGAADFLSAQLGRDIGAWSYLGGYLDGGDGRRRLKVQEVSAADPETGKVEPFVIASDIDLQAIPVHHGEVPSLAFVVRTRGRTLLFAGDQSASSTGFDRITMGLAPDLLIAHHVIPEGEGQPIGLHRPPSEIGRMAANINPEQLLLSHHMTRSFSRLEESLAAISVHYQIPAIVAADGTCVPL